jgi:hypothetical protein
VAAAKGVVHLKSVTRTNQLGDYVSGRALEEREAAAARAHAEGFAVADIPDDGQVHTRWPYRCEICTAAQK